MARSQKVNKGIRGNTGHVTKVHTELKLKVFFSNLQFKDKDLSELPFLKYIHIIFLSDSTNEQKNETCYY